MSPRARIGLVLGLLAALVVFERLHTFREPVDRDVATYAVVARELRAGRALYSEVWDHKPPAVYVAYAAAQVMAGDGPASVFLLGVTAAVGTLVCLYAATRHASAAAGLWAAAFWALVASDLRLQANQPNTEVLINLALAAAFALLLRARGDSEDPALAAGACLAAATLVKPVAMVTAILLAAAHVAIPPEGVRRRTAAGQALLILGTCAGAWLLMGGYLAATGRWNPAWKALVTYNSFYAGSASQNLLDGLSPERLFPRAMRAVMPLAAAAGFGLLLAARSRPSRRVVLLLAWLLSAPVLVALPGKFFAHYYQLWLPPLCVAAAWSVAAVAERWRRPWAGTLVGGAVALALALLQRPAYALAADDWSRVKYGDVFLRSREVAGDLEKMLGPEDTFYHWGNQPELYLYTRRRPPGAVLWSQHLMHGPLRYELRSLVLHGVAIADPEMVVLTRDEHEPPGALGVWFRERYDPHPLLRRRAGFSFWVRRGGKLQRRLYGL